MSKAKLRAEAIDRFVTDAKAQGVYSSLKAACILTGWDTLAGALTPLVGSAPTNSGFIAADYDRGGQGLKGNGSSKWIGTNRIGTADSQNDFHQSVHMTVPAPAVIGGSSRYLMGDTDSGNTNAILQLSGSLNESFQSSPSGSVAIVGTAATVGFRGMSRTSSTALAARSAGTAASGTVTSVPRSPYQVGVYASAFGVASATSHIDARLSWYSIGSSVDLSALDTLVTRLMADLRAIEEDGMDRDALSYCRAVEAADGSFMVTGVKNAVDRLVKGLKYDKDSNGRSAWDAIGASCLLCGPRTIAGALVPLKGVAPTAQGAWTSSDYNQETGLKGNGSTLYLNTNRANNADPQNDFHIAAHATVGGTGTGYFIGAQTAASAFKLAGYAAWAKATAATASGTPSSAGTYAVSRSSASTFQYIKPPSGVTSASVASVADAPYSTNDYVFAFANSGGAASGKSDARLAFYSIGASLSLSALDSRITKYVADVAAAIP